MALLEARRYISLPPIRHPARLDRDSVPDRSTQRALSTRRSKPHHRLFSDDAGIKKKISPRRTRRRQRREEKSEVRRQKDETKRIESDSSFRLHPCLPSVLLRVLRGELFKLQSISGYARRRRSMAKPARLSRPSEAGSGTTVMVTLSSQGASLFLAKEMLNGPPVVAVPVTVL